MGCVGTDKGEVIARLLDFLVSVKNSCLRPRSRSLMVLYATSLVTTLIILILATRENGRD